MSAFRTIAVAGTHGKTTTTAMATCALRGAGADPSFAIGAYVDALGTNAYIGAGEFLVAEADESDGAFLVYSPEVAVVTNVDVDHLDNWGSEAAYHQAFAAFVTTVGRGLVVNVDDPGSAALVAPARGRGLQVVTVSLHDSSADVYGRNLVVDGAGTRLTAVADGAEVALELAVHGEHYALDALLALAVGYELGFELDALATGLSSFTGAARRMSHVGDVGTVTIYDSYAHHPTEIKADLAAARAIAQGRRLLVAFQPHLVSRTRVYGVAMGEALADADEVVLADIYLAREQPDPDVTSVLIAEAIDGPDVTLAGDVADVPGVLTQRVRPGDFVLTLGAGDITQVGPKLLAKIQET